MLPSTKPVVTALPAFCLWKPSTAPLPAVPLLLNNSVPPSKAGAETKVVGWLKTVAALKVVAALTVSVSLAVVPRVELPKAAKEVPVLTVTGA